VNKETVRFATLLTLSGAYIALNLMVSIVSIKVAVVFGVTFAAGVLLSQLSYGLLDVMNDWRGKTEARAMVTSAIIIRALFYFVVMPIIFFLPTSISNENYDKLLGGSMQLAVAGMLSLFISSWLINVSLFSWLREKTKGRWFILRYCVTTLPAFVVSSTIIAFVGYWGVPGVDLLKVAFGTTVARMVIAVLYIPVVFVIRRVVRKLAE
jgi:uncharacterized integral membrane protein (TIGR00697 family)